MRHTELSTPFSYSSFTVLLDFSGWGYPRIDPNKLPWFVQFITVGFAVTPLFFMWEKLIGVHKTKSLLLRAVCRVPVMLPVWFFAIAFPFFGPINSTVGALLVTFTVYIIPCAAHMWTFRSATARQVLDSKLTFFIFFLKFLMWERLVKGLLRLDCFFEVT